MKYKVIKSQNVSHNCFVCGLTSDASLRTRFYELEEGWLLGIPAASGIHQSYPGRMHGGVITALIDETVGRAVQINQPEVWGVTVKINVRFVNPVPLEDQIYVIGRITAQDRMFMEGEGKLFHSVTGQTYATGTAKYLKLAVNKISVVDIMHEDWIQDPREVPEFVDLPINLSI